LTEGYVLFHPSGQSLESQPWDKDVLDIANAKTVGGFTFYKYMVGTKGYATKLAIKEIKLVSGGDKGTSLPCSRGEYLSCGETGNAKPYRYDIATGATWTFEFTYNIQQGTPEIDLLKSRLAWQLQYTHNVDNKTQQVTTTISHTGNRFSIKIPPDVMAYTVQLIPFIGPNQSLCNGFNIALKKKELIVFNGSTIKWLDENGSVIPFENGNQNLKELPAFSGNPDKRAPRFQNVVNEGPIPEGTWWIPRDNLQSYDSLGWWDKTFGRTWPGGEQRWGKYRIWLEPDGSTNARGRDNFCLNGSSEAKTGGNIHVGDPFKLFVDAFTHKVGTGGRLKLLIGYELQNGKKLGALSSKYETGGRGSITVSIGAGDAGGVSYGAYQMTSKPSGGTVTGFVQATDFPWQSEFVGLMAGSDVFSKKWKDVVTAHNDAFVEIEHAFIKKTHFDPLVDKIKRENNIDVSEHSRTLNDVIWSTAVQHGKSTGVIGIAINNVTIPVSFTKEYDETLIKEIYAERGRKKADGNLMYFSKNSPDVQVGVAKRFENELKQALEELKNENF
jgi:hypothetical protein